MIENNPMTILSNKTIYFNRTNSCYKFRDNNCTSDFNSKIGLSSIVFFVLLSIAILLLPPLAFAKKTKGNVVEDLSYGVVLYELFQENQFKALTELMVAEQQSTLPHHLEFAKVLKGGIHLSYGMDEAAKNIFDSVIESHPNKENTARAWFYLGKLLYKKSDYPAARGALIKVSEHLSPELQSELAFMWSKITLSANRAENDSRDFTANNRALLFDPAVDKQSIYRYYRDYNRAVSAIVKDSTPLAQQAILLSQLEQQLNQLKPQKNEEFELGEVLDLRDRVLISLGFVYLKLEKSDAAITSFSKVRQNSGLAGKALVGYGWSAINAGNYEEALAPILALQARSMSEPTTYEALLAVPYIYEKLGIDNEAINSYQFALDKMAAEMSVLKRLGEKIMDGGAKAVFVDVGADNRLNTARESTQRFSSRLTGKPLIGNHWLSVADSLVDPGDLASPELQAHLSGLLADKSMRTLLGQLNDIDWLEANLNAWQGKIETLEFAVNERTEKNLATVNESTQNVFVDRLRLLEKTRENLLEQIARAGQPAGKVLLMNQLERKSYQRIQSALRRLDKTEETLNRVITKLSSGQMATAPSRTMLAEKRKTLIMMQGLLLWQVSLDASSREWGNEKKIDEIDRALVQVKLRVRHFPELILEQTKQAQYHQRLSLERQRIEVQSKKLNLLRMEAEIILSQRLMTEIAARKNRLTAYIAQARLSKAIILERRVLEQLPSGSSTSTSTSTTTDGGSKVSTKNEALDSGRLL